MVYTVYILVTHIQHSEFPEPMKAPLPRADHTRALVDWVAASLREAILGGYFDPGEKLDQSSIAAEFEVSRTPVREAVKILEAEGLVDSRRHRGAYVATVSPEDIRNVYEVRAVLESEIVAQVTPFIPGRILGDLEHLLAESQAQLEAGDVSKQGSLDCQFHNTLLQFGQNELMKGLLDGIANRIRIVRQFALSHQSRSHVVESLTEHRDILRAVRQGDSGEAADSMRSHLKLSAHRIAGLIGESGVQARVRRY